MKKSLFVAAVAALALVSCGGDKKVEEKVENKDSVRGKNILYFYTSIGRKKQAKN